MRPNSVQYDHPHRAESVRPPRATRSSSITIIDATQKNASAKETRAQRKTMSSLPILRCKWRVLQRRCQPTPTTRRGGGEGCSGDSWYRQRLRTADHWHAYAAFHYSSCKKNMIITGMWTTIISITKEIRRLRQHSFWPSCVHENPGTLHRVIRGWRKDAFFAPHFNHGKRLLAHLSTETFSLAQKHLILP